MRDRLAAFLYWAAYWLERAADRSHYGYENPKKAVRRRLPIREVTLAEFDALTKEDEPFRGRDAP